MEHLNTAEPPTLPWPLVLGQGGAGVSPSRTSHRDMGKAGALNPVPDTTTTAPPRVPETSSAPACPTMTLEMTGGAKRTVAAAASWFEDVRDEAAVTTTTADCATLGGASQLTRSLAHWKQFRARVPRVTLPATNPKLIPSTTKLHIPLVGLQQLRVHSKDEWRPVAPATPLKGTSESPDSHRDVKRVSRPNGWWRQAPDKGVIARHARCVPPHALTALAAPLPAPLSCQEPNSNHVLILDMPARQCKGWGLTATPGRGRGGGGGGAWRSRGPRLSHSQRCLSRYRWRGRSFRAAPQRSR